MNEQHEALIRARGAADGKAAATWFFDGNTGTGVYERVLKGIEDGDPEIMDSLPHADLSGQWADSLTFDEIFREELGCDHDENYPEELSEYRHFEDTGDGESGPHLECWHELDELITVYEDAYSSAAQDEIVRVCNYQLADDKLIRKFGNEDN